MNILKPEKKLAVISALTEGCSIRSIVRMTGVHKKTGSSRITVGPSVVRSCVKALSEAAFQAFPTA